VFGFDLGCDVVLDIDVLYDLVGVVDDGCEVDFVLLGSLVGVVVVE